MPFLQGNGTGRDHNPDAFTCFLAGAGVKSGFSYGESDDYGFKVAVDPVEVHDFNATILHLLGLDHERLSFYHNGLERRPHQCAWPRDQGCVGLSGGEDTRSAFVRSACFQPYLEPGDLFV